MSDLLRLWMGAIQRLFSSRKTLLLENLALRQQLAVLKRKNKRPKLNALDRMFWIVLKRLWAEWKNCLIIVTPATIVGWHRAGFRFYWKLLSKARVPSGRKPINKEIRDLIFRISERTVSRWVQRAPRNPEHAKRWQTFLQNHREAISAMDFFAVPTITFGLLHCFFIIGHDRRRILHFGVTQHPTSCWVAQQLREALPYEYGYQHLIFDHDAKFGFEVETAIEALGLNAVRTSIRSPWQNGVAERWVGSCRRDLLDHVIPLNEQHLKRLLSEYICYYHADRTHLALKKDTPAGRSTAKTAAGWKIVSSPKLGGLHHGYDLAA